MTGAGAANRASKAPGVDKATWVGTTPRAYKIMTQSGNQVKSEQLSRRTGAVLRSDPHVQGAAAQKIALDEGRGGKPGGDTRRNAGFTVQKQGLTERGNMSFGIKGGMKGAGQGRLVNSASGKLSANPAARAMTKR